MKLCHRLAHGVQTVAADVSVPPRPFLLLVLALAPFAAPAARARDPTPPAAAPPKYALEWARLKTSGKYWDRHADYDHDLIQFMRENTALDVDPVWHSASIDDLAAMCRFPFLLAANLDGVTPGQRRNLVEYVRHGGFLFFDACLDPAVNPEPMTYVKRQIGYLAPDFPHLTIHEMLPTNSLFSVYFKLTSTSTRFWALYDRSHLLGMVSLGSTECDLAGFGRLWTPSAAAKMLTNVYFYALLAH